MTDDNPTDDADESNSHARAIAEQLRDADQGPGANRPDTVTVVSTSYAAGFDEQTVREVTVRSRLDNGEPFEVVDEDGQVWELDTGTGKMINADTGGILNLRVLDPGRDEAVTFSVSYVLGGTVEVDATDRRQARLAVENEQVELEPVDVSVRSIVEAAKPDGTETGHTGP